MANETNPLIDFYLGQSPDRRGRTIRKIWAFKDDELEAVHDFIQWLFPLAERSGFNPSAPVLDAETIQAFRERPELRANLRVSLERMLRVYGFELIEGETLRVMPAPNFAERADNWLSYSNHNHLRITRILKSLCLLGLKEEAEALFRTLDGLYGTERQRTNPRISEKTYQFWRAAAVAGEGLGPSRPRGTS